MTDKLKDQQRRFMLYNLFAFTLIFILFAGIVYSQIEKTILGGVREDLGEARYNIESSDDYITRQLELIQYMQAPHSQQDGGYREFDRNEGGISVHARLVVPMRAIVLIRDSSGEVLNPQATGRIFFEGYLEELPFSTGDLDRIQTFELSDGSAYLSTAFMRILDEEVYFVQLMANVDGEQGIVTGFFRLLAICVAVFVLLSITASYILSRSTMKPVITAWRRQSEFVENASHELRTPLTIIQNKLEALLTTPDATVMDRADEVVVTLSETRRLTKLTADLMTLARADADETLIEREAFDIGALLTELCEPYREMAEADGKSFVLEVSPTLSLTADRSRIHELMVILLDNALKYTREGDAITVSAGPAEGGVLIEVRDTGIGMGKEAMTRAFDRFYREDKARTREKGGSGLGLSIAKWIVDVHGGSIALLPGEGDGVTVQVKIK